MSWDYLRERSSHGNGCIRSCIQDVQWWTNFFLGAPERARKKIGAQNQSARLIERQLEKLIFALYYLNRTWAFIFNVFPSKVFAMRLLKSECCFNVWNKMLFKEQFSKYKRIRLKVFKRTRWKHGILLKINSAKNTLIIICRTFSEQIFLRMAPDKYFW